MFALDLLAPLGLPVWFLYLLPVLLSSRLRWDAAPLAAAGFCSVLTGLGLYISPPGIPFSHSLIIRLFGVALIWTAALALIAPRTADVSQGTVSGMDRRTIGSLIGAGLMVTFLVVASHLGMTDHQDSEQFVARTHEVLTHLAQVRATLTEAETGQRGFLLTGQDRHLEIYNQALAHIGRSIAALKALTQDNPVQQQRLARLQALIDEKLSDLRETIAAHRRAGMDASLAIVRTNRGKQAMDSIRSALAEMEGAERDLLAGRSRASEIHFQSLTSFLVIGGLLLIGLLVAAALLWRRQEASQRAREALILAARRHAETIVDTVRTPLLVLDADLRVQRANHSFYESFHVTREETEHRLLYELGNGEWNIPQLRDLLTNILPDYMEVKDFEVHWEFPAIGRRTMLLNARKLYRPGNNTEHILLSIEDITERQRAEEAWRKAAAEVRDLYDKAPCGYHSLGKDGVFLDLNQTELDWLGYTREEMVGNKKFSDLLTSDSLARFQANFPIFKQRGWVRDLEFDLVRKDGSILPVLLNAAAVKDAEGRYLSSRSTLFDMTERKAAEDRLRSSQIFLDSIIENIPNMLFVKDARDLKFVRFNKAGEQLLGYRSEELIGKNDYDFFPKEEADFFTSKDRAVLDSNQLLDIPEEEIETRYHGRRILHTSKIPILDKDGRPQYLLGISEDITERKRTDTAMREVLATLDATTDGTFIFDPQTLRFTYVNEGAVQQVRYSREELLRMTPLDIKPEFEEPRFRALIAPLMSGQQRVRHFETVHRRKDGVDVPVEINLQSVGVGTAQARLIAIVRDITERKQAEEALRGAHAELEQRVEERTQDLARKTRDLETLLYVTSHDLREPLRSIENFSRMVEERYADRLDDKGKDFIRRVVRGAQRMDQLMADLLALSRVQRMELSQEIIEGESIVREALRRLEDRIKETEATVRVVRPLPRFRANGTWATQGIYNLLANALKFRRPDGAPPDIEVAAYQSNGGDQAVGLTVRDRGPGVPTEHAERIFQLFQRAVGREVEGTGAGLAIVRQVAERHGGHAWVQPREGGGSEFILTFGPAVLAEANKL